MYHHIHKDSSKFHSLNADKFKKQINFLKKNYSILTPSEFYKKLKKKNLTIKIVFLHLMMVMYLNII